MALVEIYYGGRLNRPLVTFQQAGRKGSSSGTPLVLPLTLCDLAAITQPEVRSPWPHGVSCSCISYCPTGSRPHGEAGHRPTSVRSFRQEAHRLPSSCAGSPGSSARSHCWFRSLSGAHRESHSRSEFPQYRLLLSLRPPAASWLSTRKPLRQPSPGMTSCSPERGWP